jgi:hypothetical protein
VELLESIITESRKLEVANHEAVRIIAAQLDRAKRIVIVQQAILSAVSRCNLSDLDISISTAQHLVGDDREWLAQAIENRFFLTFSPCIAAHVMRLRLCFMRTNGLFAGGDWSWRHVYVQR